MSAPRWCPILLALVSLVRVPSLPAQSSSATLMGTVTAQADGKPVPGTLVIYRNLNTNASGYASTNSQGLYAFQALPPGRYEVSADKLGFRPGVRPDIELTVGGRVEVNFTLQAMGAAPATMGPAPSPAAPLVTASGRNSAVSRRFLATIYGPDAQAPQAVEIGLPAPVTETLSSTISTVIDERKILELPHSGRDVYTLLVLQPGVTSDNATGRGLGFSVNGQRPSGTNFLLDGVDNNDLLVTGPAARVSADAVQEYRMTTNNFSAEFGRATAFIANAVTRSGANSLHGTGYEFFNHDRLNANSFLNNALEIPRPPFRQNQYGGTLGGPIRRDRLFFFAGFERAHSNSQSPDFPVYVPSRRFVAGLKEGSVAKKLLTEFPPPAGEIIPFYPAAEEVQFHFPLAQRNTMIVARGDYGAPGGRNRLSARYSLSQSTADDFILSVYPGLNSPLVARVQNLAVNHTRNVSASGVNELKFGLNRNRVGFERPRPDIPTLTSLRDPVLLPGSEAFYAYSFSDWVVHGVDNYSVLRGRHSLVAGGEWRQNFNNSVISAGRDGQFLFDNILAFGVDEPYSLAFVVDRFTGRALRPSEYERSYGQKEFGLFLQDNLKLRPRLTLNLGLRYEYFGVPLRRDGPPDWNLFYGPGRNRRERLAKAELRRRAPYAPDRNNFAPRFGFALDLFGNHKTVLRGGYGISYDRLFNNVWLDVRNNSLAYVLHLTDDFGQRRFKYLFPAIKGLPEVSEIYGLEVTFHVDEKLRAPYAQSWFLGLQREITKDLVVEVDHAGSLGRKLVTADDTNRPLSDLSAEPGNNQRLHPTLASVSYRGNEGTSDYLSLQAAARQRFSHGLQFQVSYTYSRTRDAQSDPFRNPSLDFSVPAAKRLTDPGLTQIIHSSFTRQFDSRLDRGLSDFDQTHNLVLNVLYLTPRTGPLPRFTGNWQVAALAAFRSGFPFTVVAPGNELSFDGSGFLNHNRPDLVGPSRSEVFLHPRRPGEAGVFLLDKSKFKDPAFGEVGNLPRNAFRGPGFWNTDFGISRSFALRRLGEQGRLQFRADFFNLLNHANLGNPEISTGSETFGLARFGRQGFGGSLPSVSPLNEQPRRIQFALKFLF